MLYPKDFHIEKGKEKQKQYDLVRHIAFRKETWEEYRDFLYSAGLADWVDGKEYYDAMHARLKAGKKTDIGNIII
jgi:hypothetical protein